jgi:hypothetical protein
MPENSVGSRDSPLSRLPDAVICRVQLHSGRRKVLLWSRRPWSQVDSEGHPSLPGGRFVAGVTETPLGAVSVTGVCIPWRAAHVSTGRKDRKPWQDHHDYLTYLPQSRSFAASGLPRIVVGDFNVRIPRKYTPKLIYEELMAIFERWEIPTAGPIPVIDQLVVDHVAHSPELTAIGVSGWPKDLTGVKLSDHPGTMVEFAWSGDA